MDARREARQREREALEREQAIVKRLSEMAREDAEEAAAAQQMPPPNPSLMGGNRINLITPSPPPAQRASSNTTSGNAIKRERSPDEEPAQQEEQPKKRKTTLMHTISEDPLFHAVAEATDGSGYVELRCNLCGGNARQCGEFLKGVNGFHKHLKHVHSVPSLSFKETLERCTYRRLTAVEAAAVANGDHGTYKVSQIVAESTAAPDSHLRGTRKQKATETPVHEEEKEVNESEDEGEATQGRTLTMSTRNEGVRVAFAPRKSAPNLGFKKPSLGNTFE